jgi:ABC-type bacteriocin/lantibiotic exporter with double-glycine peptidase domain
VPQLNKTVVSVLSFDKKFVMNTVDRKWPLLTIVSLGIGIGTIFVAGRSLARAAFHWQFSKKSNVIQTRLKNKLENPLQATTVVTRISEWDDVYSMLLRYVLAAYLQVLWC